MVIKDEYMMAARLSKRGKTHQIPLRLWQTVDDIACRRWAYNCDVIRGKRERNNTAGQWPRTTTLDQSLTA